MIDTLFPPIVRQATYTASRLITCLVCKRGGRSTHPRLCELCAADLHAARCHVNTMLHGVELRVERTHEAWLATEAAMDDALRGRWNNYETARIEGDPRAAQAEEQARSGKADPLLDVLRLWLDYQDAGEQYEATMRWVKECEAVL